MGQPAIRPAATGGPKSADQASRQVLRSPLPVSDGAGGGTSPLPTVPDSTGPSLFSQVRLNLSGWVTSTVLHVLVIVGLALLTTRAPSRSVMRLEVMDDADDPMQWLDELQFELASDEQQLSTVSREGGMWSRMDPVLRQPIEPAAVEEFGLPDDSNPAMMEMLGSAIEGEQIDKARTGSSFFGIEIAGKNIVYVVDRSGSMQGHRWESARGELIKSITSLGSDQKFFVFLFSDSCHPMPQLAGPNRLVPATPENIQDVTKWLVRQVPDDRTKPKGSLLRGLRMKPDIVFLLTDGIFQDDTGPYLLQRARIQQSVSQPESLVIHTIAFHCRDGLTMLQQIAENYRGTFRLVE